LSGGRWPFCWIVLAPVWRTADDVAVAATTQEPVFVLIGIT